MDIVQAEKTFVQKMQSKNWSKRTIENYCCQVRIFLNEFKGRDRARNITAKEIEEYNLLYLQCSSVQKIKENPVIITLPFVLLHYRTAFVIWRVLFYV